MKEPKPVRVPGRVISTRAEALDYVEFLKDCMHDVRTPAMASVIRQTEERLVKAGYITPDDF